MLHGIYKKIGLFFILLVIMVVPTVSLHATSLSTMVKDRAFEDNSNNARARYLNEYKKEYSDLVDKIAGSQTSNQEDLQRKAKLEYLLPKAMSSSEWASFSHANIHPNKISNVSFGSLYNGNTDGVQATDIYTRKEGTDDVYTSNNPKFKDVEFTLSLKSDGTYQVKRAYNPVTKQDFSVTTEAQLQALKKAAEADDVEIVCYTGVSTILSTINPLCWIAKFSYYIIFTISSWFLSISGQLFNFVVVQTVVEMKELIQDNIVNQGWILFRDIINILFIFVLIYAAISTILKGTSDTGKTIVTVIVVAVLINFSLFFTKVIVDISNTLAVSFYNSITTMPLKDAKGKPVTINSSAQFGIAEVFLTQTNMTTIVGTNPENIKWGVASLTYLGIIKQTLIASVFIVILGVVLLLMSLMLVTRFLILIFVMITSSLAFGSYILPKLQSQVADKWWPALIGQAFFVPVFFLMLYITLKFSQTLPFDKGTGWANMAHIVPGQIVTYIMIVGMLILSMKVAKSMADEAGAASGKITGMLGGAALSVTGFAARHSIGIAAREIANSKLLSGSGLTARTLRAGFGRIGESSFDARHSDTFSHINDAVGGTDFGKGRGEGGYDKFADKREKYHKEKYAEEEKAYKEEGKFTDDEQDAVTAGLQFEKENKSAMEVKKLVDARDKLAARQAAAATQLEKDAIQKHIDNVNNEINKKDITEADAKAIYDNADNKKILDAKKKAEAAAKERQTKFLESRQKTRWGIRSGDGAKFAREQLAKNAKEKTDTDRLLEGLKASANSGGGGGGKP